MSRSKRIAEARGFTLTEAVVVLGIVGFLASILMPMMAKARREAGLAQCTNHLRQIGQALIMYNVDHSSSLETYPDRLTHLRDLGYVGDARVFICPMDYTRATKDPASGRTGLKPYFNPQIPNNDYNYWAERNPPVNSDDWLRLPTGEVVAKTSNCSYIYEFSTRTDYVGGYTPTNDPETVAWNGGGWAADTLVTQYSYNWWYSEPPAYTYNPNVDTFTVWEWVSGYDAEGNEILSGIAYPANPMDVDRDRNGRITWQDAKFHQLQNADAYVTGYSGPGEGSIPVSWSWDPYDTCFADSYMIMPNYPRSLMPIVRCFWHSTPAEVDNQDVETVLNLAMDGNTFFSVPGWEQSAWKYGHGATREPTPP